MQVTIQGVMETNPDPVAEGRRLLDAAQAVPVTVRLVGGVAVNLRCSSASVPPLARIYKDLDFVGLSKESSAIEKFFPAQGYSPNRRFNALNGHRRLLFEDESRARQVDVLLDTFEMCHRFDIRPRLELESDTLPVADLLLTKLQVVEANEKDVLDILALFLDHPVDESAGGIDAAYIAELCAKDWGLYRTLQLSRERVREFSERLDQDSREVVLARVDSIYDRIERQPKSLAWKLRAKVGDRVQWYEQPDEVG